MTINLNQARKLAELGVKRDAEKILAWSTNNKYELFITSEIEIPDLYCLPNVFPAYNAEELLGMMSYFNVALEQAENKWWCYDNEPAMPHATIHGGTLTEALGNKLIHDIENNIITIEEINK